MLRISAKQRALFIVALLNSWQLTFAQSVTYEAEKGSLNGVQVATTQSGYSGTGYVTGFDAASDSVTFNVQSGSKSLYDVEVRYSSPNGEKYTKLSLNYGGGADVRLASTSSWAYAPAGQLLLNAGTNTISLTSNWGWYNIDALRVTPASTPAGHKVTGALQNSKATAATKGLMNFLTKNYGNHIISGQQDPTYVTWITQNIGKTPAIVGLDFIDYSPSRVERGTTSHAVEDGIAFDARGGIVTFCWHWNPPSGIIDTPGKEWHRAFYSDSTTFDIAAVMNNPNGNDYKLLIRDIDVIANLLKRLQSANIPVLWRPLHEAEGGWFWWGAKGPEACKKLWVLMHDRMTNYHGLNNLIWVWNSVQPSWYPGDSTVDILGLDSYPSQKGDHNPVSSGYQALISLGQDKKIVTLSEVGEIPDPDLMKLYHTDWSWFCTWGGEFVTDGQHNSASYLRTLYGSSYVLTLDEIGGWKGTSGGGATPTTTTTKQATAATTTTKAATTTQGGGGGATQTKYGQCGGTGWTGPTVCTGSTCQAVSPPWYYQCL